MLSDDKILKRISINLKRRQNGRSWAQIARDAGCATIQVTNVVNEKHMPGVGLLYRIAKAVGCSLDELVAPVRQRSRC